MTGKFHHIQGEPENFSFTAEHLQQARSIVARYPAGRQQSALLPLLALAQQQNGGWLPKAAMDTVAEMLGMAPVRVYEVASFYTMYNLEPVGRNVINICTTTPCWLRGSDEIMQTCEERLGVACGETTPDGEYTLREVECLGACVNAPMCQIINAQGEYFYEDLTPDSMNRIIQTMERGVELQPGPQSGRKSTEPVSND